jgi:hypothetical protein
MHTDKSWVNPGQCLAILTLTGVLVGCGGSSGGGSAATGASTTSGSSSSGSSGSSGGSSGGSGPTVTVLFEQPQESGIAGHLVVPVANHTPPQTGVFELVLWQANPNVADGQLVPTTWDASSQTGFAPSSSLSTTQLGFQNQAGTTTAQMDGGTVGAYLNSANLPGSPVDQKMMITPQFVFASGNAPVPFADANSSLSASMDLQIPTALGNNTYVTADLLFRDPNGVRISFGVKIFSLGQTEPVVGTGYNAPGNSYMLNSPLQVDQQYLTLAQGSAAWSRAPWLGLRHFEWSISQAQFVAGLKFLVSTYPGKVQYTDPTQYVLAEVHLNAEFQFQPDPAELGWSMSGWKIWTTE